MLLCKCLSNCCPQKHWSDLTEEEQQQVKVKLEMELPEREDKSWPPSGMETK